MALRGMPRFYWQRFQVLQAKIVGLYSISGEVTRGFSGKLGRSPSGPIWDIEPIFGEMGGVCQIAEAVRQCRES